MVETVVQSAVAAPPPPPLFGSDEMVENLPCTECGMICATETTLLEHLKAHKKTSLTTPEKRVGSVAMICPYCSREFSDKHKYDVHVRFHTGETPFKCPVCNKGFRDSKKMKVSSLGIITFGYLLLIGKTYLCCV